MMNKPNLLSSICYALLGCILAVSLAGCTTQDKDDETVALYTGEKILVGRDELESFVDDFIAEQLDQRHIPGLTIIVVQDGQVLLAKGYGSANLEEEVAFDPNETVVRIASISKLFVATAVMQLVEQGKLDLHADVNQYLGDSAFQVDDTFPEPVTLAHLLTHTSGYGESTENNTDPAAIPPLETYLAENMPPRLEPPGESWIYSGHGMAIAALVVEKVSGLPFDQYVLENTLEPLDMNQSYYLLSPPLPDDLAMGYAYQDGEYIPQLIEYYGDYPAASLVSTAADMAKFMIAHLQEGCYQGQCILQPATIADMHQRQTSTPFGGHAYGFVEGIKNGQRLIGHTGAIHGFGSVLDLLPTHDLAYFFSFNLECMDSSACGIIPEFRQQFLDRFLTTPIPLPPTQTATLAPPTQTPLPPTATSPPTPSATTTTVDTAPASDVSLGGTWTRPADGMDMVPVPAGSFQMGSDQAQIDMAISLCEQYPDGWGKCNQAQIFEDEAPPHTVALDGFWLDRTEVTNAQYELCVQAGACQPSRLAGNPAYNPADYPVAGVPWQQAAAYCAWAGGRLPTEAEWEYAARGASGALYPWGEAFDCQGGNFWDDDTDCDDGYPEPSPVGSFPAGASWCGALDMGGNVWEWVSDTYGAYPAADQSNPTGPTSGDQRVLRGGSWGYGPPFVRSAYRYPVPPSANYLAVGFRCAASTTLPTPTTAQEVTFSAQDGVDIAATLFGQGDLAVILLHMGNPGIDQKSWHPFAQTLAETGVAALTVDFRGRGQSGGSLDQDDLIKDARAAVGFLRDQDFERFVCMGASMGGTTCIRLAQEVELEGLVVISSVDFSGDYRVADEDLASPIPKLFISGNRDNIIPAFMVQMYHQASEPKEQIVYDSAAHGTDLFLTPHGDDFRQQLLGFLSELGSISTPEPSTTSELSPDEAATLNSLQQVDDYPLYTMHYYGDYELAEAALNRDQWLTKAKPSQGGTGACALFAALGDAEHMVYGRNFDWRYSPALLLFTSPPDGYASVSMVDIEYLVGEDKAGILLDLPLTERQELLAAPRWPFDGMNEHGLVIGMAAVPPGQVPPDPDKETLDSLDVMREVLDHARDVDEAVAILQSYNIDMGSGPPLHYLVADPSGRAILFEFYEGETVILPNETPWHLATNFLRASAGESALGECWRYDEINYQLKQSNGQITAQQAMDILSQVSQDNTEWSVVYGMSTGDIMVTMGKKYDDDPHVFHTTQPPPTDALSPTDQPSPASGAGESIASIVAQLEGLPLEEFFEASSTQLLLRSPEAVTDAGLADELGLRNDQLDDLSDAYIRETQALQVAILDLLRGYDRDTLPPEQQVSYDVYEWWLDTLVQGHPFMYHEYPLHHFIRSYHFNLDGLFSETHPLESHQDVQDYISRLSQVLRQTEQVMDGLTIREEMGIIPPKFVIQLTRSDILDYLDVPSFPSSLKAKDLPMYTRLDAALQEIDGLDEADKQAFRESALQAIETSLIPAYGLMLDYVDRVEPLATDDAGVWKLPNGDDYYAFMLRQETSTDLSPQEIHQIGLAEVDRIHQEMHDTLVAMGYPQDSPLSELMQQAVDDCGYYDISAPSQREEYVSEIERAIEQADQRVTEVFDLKPMYDVVVITGEYGGYYSPGASDGSRPGSYHVSLRGQWRPKYGLYTVAYHETIPGHHYQIATAHGLDMPTFRNNLIFNAYAEGWALYGERLAWELGLYEDNACGNLGRLQYELLRAVRLVTDTGIHAQGWTRAEAKAYMDETMSPPWFSHEVDRYVVLPAQATGYKIGMIKILELRQRAMDQLGEQFDLKAFHNVILGNGSVPLEILERIVDDWIESQLNP